MKDYHQIWEAYTSNSYITEVTDSRNIRQQLIQAYGLADETKATELINRWNKLEPYIDTDPETYGFPRNLRVNPKDIFAWSRVSKHNHESPEDAFYYIDSMLKLAAKASEQKARQKEREDDYTLIYPPPLPKDATPEQKQRAEVGVRVYEPHSEGASCKLGKGTKWCTAATKTENMFKKYINDGVKLYYIHTKHDGKFAVAVHSHTLSYEFFDESDHSIGRYDLDEILSDYEDRDGQPLSVSAIIPEAEDRPKNVLSAAGIRFARAASNGEPIEDETSKLLEVVKDIYDSDPETFQTVRFETIQPDTALLSQTADDEEVIGRGALQFFLDSEYNPPPGNSVTQHTNKRFISMLELWLEDVTDMIARGKDLEQIRQAAIAEIHHSSALSSAPAFSSGNITVGDVRWMGVSMYGLDELRRALQDNRIESYSKRWLKGPWTALHQIVVNTYAENPELAHKYDVVRELLHFTIRQNDGRYKEFEQVLLKELKERAYRAFGGKMPRNGEWSDLVEMWLEDNAGIFRINRFYNRLVAGVTGVSTEDKIINYLPYVSDLEDILNWSSPD